MGFYDYADYPSLPDDQKVLWWFDEYLRYDLVFAFLSKNSTTDDQKFTALVERHSIYNGFAWADNYSFYLHNLLNTTDLLTNDFLNDRTAYKLTYDDVTITLPPNDTRVVITYLTEDTKHRSMLGIISRTRDEVLIDKDTVDPVWLKKRAKTDYICYTKQIKFIPPHSAPYTFTIPNVASYSVVITSEGNIDNVFPDYLLYSNIVQWQQRLASPLEIETYTTAINKGSTVVDIIINVPAGTKYPYYGMLSEPDPPLIIGKFPTPKDGTPKNYIKLSYSQAITSHLIYGYPKDLFGNIYSKYSNSISFGITVSFGKLINVFHNNISFKRDAYSVGGSNGLSSETINVGWTGSNILSPDSSEIDEIIRTYEGLNEQAGFGRTVVMPNFTSPFEGTFYRVHFMLGWTVTAITWGGAVFYTKTIVTRTYNYTLLYLPEPIDYINQLIDRPLPSYTEAILKVAIKIIQGVYVMGLEQKIDEIHACLGAGEFAYYTDGGEPKPYYMNIARKLDWFAKAYGVAFNPDGSIITVRGRKNIAYGAQGATIPDGYARGQYADRINEEGKETMGIAYQNRCNIYENLSDDNSGNDVLKNGDIVLCENFLQLFESYLEDLDKGLNWQEMGGGLVPNADGTSYTTFEGMGTLLAEVAYTLSALSSNIQQTHVLALKNNAIIMEVLKGLGLPVGVGTLPVGIGGESGAGGGGSATVVFPQLSANAVSLHKRMMDVLATVSLMAGSSLGTVEEENNGI